MRASKPVHLLRNGRLAKEKSCPLQPSCAAIKSMTTATEKPTHKIKRPVAATPARPANVTQAPQEQRGSASVKKERKLVMQAAHGGLAKTKSFRAQKRSAETN